ncbi:hypothetical protein AB0K21_16270 [Streptosporangium sp. NPDC049248]
MKERTHGSHDHIDFLGRHAFTRADVAGGLCAFHDSAQSPMLRSGQRAT